MTIKEAVNKQTVITPDLSRGTCREVCRVCGRWNPVYKPVYCPWCGQKLREQRIRELFDNKKQ